MTDTEIKRASTVQARHIQQLLKMNGVQGVGIGASSDRPGEAALVIFTVRGIARDAIPTILDGLRTKIRESNRFHLGSSSKNSPRIGACGATTTPQSRPGLSQ
jgi:hypothetical protein